MTMGSNPKAERFIDKVFDEHVPSCGKSENRAGEIVRAYSRIAYRYFNDGDKVNQGYGKETCNAAARFLVKYGNEEVADIVVEMSHAFRDKTYEFLINWLEDAVYKFLDANPELFEEETEDMWDFFDKTEDYDYEEEEDEYGYVDEDW